MTAGGIIEGPTRLEGALVKSLDDATDAALQRFRLASTKASLRDCLFVCQTPFEHGVSVALISSPAEVEEDLKPAAEQQLAVQTWKTREEQRKQLLANLRKFQRGEK